MNAGTGCGLHSRGCAGAALTGGASCGNSAPAGDAGSAMIGMASGDATVSPETIGSSSGASAPA